MTTKKRFLGWSLQVMALAALSSYALAQESDKPVVSTRFQKVEATVEAIDPATREVALRGPRGNVSVLMAPEVKNFDQIHVGDKVMVSYYEGVAAQMAKGDEKVSSPAESTFAYPAKGGAKPGGGVGQSVTTTVTIQAVDPSTNTVAFKRQDGTVNIVAAHTPKMQNFIRNLKPGDNVNVTYTESVAVNVVPARG